MRFCQYIAKRRFRSNGGIIEFIMIIVIQIQRTGKRIPLYRAISPVFDIVEYRRDKIMDEMRIRRIKK